MGRTGRNQQCPCGSGEKYKRCHGRVTDSGAAPMRDAGSAPPDHVLQTFRRIHASEIRRQRLQGMGKGIISEQFGEYRIVAVADRIFYSKKWKTFHDFLKEYVVIVLGRGWVGREKAKPESERHPVLAWFSAALSDYAKTSVKVGDIYEGRATGAMMSIMSLSYNLYLTAHNANLQQRLVSRLRNPQQFWGALYETYVAAAFIKAGFKIEFENESGPSTHCEFVASDPETGQRFSVEAKTREASVQAQQADNLHSGTGLHLGVGMKVGQALNKKADGDRVIFVELSLPVAITDETGPAIVDAATSELDRCKEFREKNGIEIPPAYIFVTNYAAHHLPSRYDHGQFATVLGFNIQDFGSNSTIKTFKENVYAEEKHKSIYKVFNSIKTHYEIPATFDGELPAFAFGQAPEHERLIIGEQYPIHDTNGKEAIGVLTSAIMVEREKEIVAAFSLSDGRSVLCKIPVTDPILSAYRASPETFFGEVRAVSRQAKTPLELFDFFYETYKETSKEKLIEFMAAAADIEHLKLLTQKDLAIEYCTRMVGTLSSSKRGAPPKESAPAPKAPESR